MNFKALFTALMACLLLGTCPLQLAAKDKIALLFLTRSDPNHPTLWKTLISEASKKYTVYIHSKEPMQDPFFQQYRIDKIVPTTWAIHAKAWHALIQEAIKNPENKYFAFISESCIPLYSLDHIYSAITHDSRTHMAFAKPWWPKDCPTEVHSIPPEYRHGNTEWMVLNRKHAELVANDRAIIRIIARHTQDQESYFSTFFAISNALVEDICNHSYTYIDWEHNTNNGANPYSFAEVSSFNDGLIDYAYSIGALFARKFTKEYPEMSLLQMIRNHTPSSYDSRNP